MTPIKFKQMGPHPWAWLAYGFGAGLSPKAPGTVGTLVAIPIYLLMVQAGLAIYSLLVLVSIAGGIWICQKASDQLQSHDHPGIVWDEVAGFLLTMWMIPVSLYTVIAGFVLFRIFDILKPWPIRVADSKVSGGFGIMLDDLIAAIFANLCLQLLLIFAVI